MLSWNQKMEKTKKKISDKESEISNKEDELILAKAKENDQYESMKKRIRFMYENGNTGFIEILCSSKSIGEFLNNAEYISTISGYDRNMLVEFQKVVTDVENQEAELQKEYKQLQTMQDDLIAKQDNVNQLLTSKQSEIQKLDSELGDTKNKLAQLEAAAAAAEKKQKEAAEAAAAAKKVQAAAASKNTGSSSSSAGSPVVSGNGTFTHPCPAGYISSTFGYRTQPIAGASTNHKGIDFAAATGTPIYAATAGTVISAGYAGNAGNLLVINHGNGLLTYYMHCSKIYVSAGQKVSKGQIKKEIQKSTFVSSDTTDHMHEKKLNFKQEIDVRGMRGDEALQTVTYFIDDAIQVGASRVRILHGKGTGILRQLIRDYLHSVPGVRHYHDEHVQLGGAGITVVELD